MKWIAVMRELRTFLTLAGGQIMSAFGTGLTNFSLGIWVLERTGSVTQYAILLLIATIPGIIVAPFTGALVDRMDRRHAMLIGEIGSTIYSLSLAFLYLTDLLSLGAIAAAVAINSVFVSLKSPAYSASITLIVPKEHLGRASGIGQFGLGVANILAPLAAGVLLMMIKLPGIIVIDFVTYLISIGALLVVRIPKLESKTTVQKKPSVWREVSYGFEYIKTRAGLLGLLIYFAYVHIFVAMSNVLMAPMMLKFASVATIGTIVSFTGIGLMTGSLIMSAWGGPRSRIRGIFGFAVLQAISFILTGLRPNAVLISAGLFFECLSLPIIHGCNRVIWQTKTNPEVQGRVFALSSMSLQLVAPIGYLLAGPLADKIFEPMLAAGGRLSGTVGLIIGTGPGRGMGLMLILMGIMILGAIAVAFFNPRIRNLEEELPDSKPVVVVGNTIAQAAKT